MNRRRIGGLVALGALLYLGAMIALAVALPRFGDRAWPATLVLFGPRWLLAVPLLALAPAALLFRRWALVPLAAAGGILLFPVLGLRVPVRALLDGERPGQLRVATFNAGGKPLAVGALKGFVAAVRPDLMAIQECQVEKEKLAQALPGFSVEVDTGMCLVSRHRIEAAESRSREDVWQRGGSGAIVRYTIELPARADAAGVDGAPTRINLVNLHLETVREAIEALTHRAWRGAGEHDENIALRDWESTLARQWVDMAAYPVVITGDLNMPVDSALYRRHWAGFTNAFSSAGLGFGHTKETRWFGIRIDHVLLGEGWKAERAWVGPNLGSDHLPLVADLRWVGSE